MPIIECFTYLPLLHFQDGWDPFCWKCRECDKVMPCSKCLRSFHTYCVRPASTKFDASWKCPECLLIESAPKR